MEIEAWYGTVDIDSGRIRRFESMDEMAAVLLDPLPKSVSKGHMVQPDIRYFAKRAGIYKDDSSYDEDLRSVSIKLVAQKLEMNANSESEALSMIEALDDFNASINLLEERLFEWSRLYRGDLIRGQRLAESMADHPSLAPLAMAVLDLRNRREDLQSILERSINQLAPNLSDLAGPLLAARLISRAGGLSRLARMPASSIQVMGAEKSLFKHLKGRAPSPKHGIIYRHPAVAAAPKWAKGKVSRALASKLAIAARIDDQSGVLLPDVHESFNRRLIEIRSSSKRPRGPRQRSR